MSGYEPGDTIGRYQVVRQFGSDGLTDSYVVHDPLLSRNVILLRPIAEDEETVHRARRDAIEMSRVAHSAIIPVLDAGEQGGVPFTVVEHIDGQTLGRTFERGGLRVPGLVRILIF